MTWKGLGLPYLEGLGKLRLRMGGVTRPRLQEVAETELQPRSNAIYHPASLNKERIFHHREPQPLLRNSSHYKYMMSGLAQEQMSFACSLAGLDD